jgi:uncharacterized phiE125 gp8 family phage protein
LELIEAAEKHLERELGRALLTQTRTAYFDCLSCRGLELPIAPVQSVTSITYVDVDQAEQTLPATDYFVRIVDGVARIVPATGKTWPATAYIDGAVKVVFIAGYGEAADVPADLKQAIKMLAAHLYENREATLVGQSASVIPFGIGDLVMPYRRYVF